jgi:F0F1-type ATP synthase epsilon subunit
MFKLIIRTPYEEVYKGEANAITFANEEGEMQVLEDHASMTATLDFSHILVEEENRDETFLGRKGILTFDNESNEALLLLAYCEKESEVDYSTVVEYIAFIEKQLKEGKDLSEFQKLYLRDERVIVKKQIEIMEK